MHDRDVRDVGEERDGAECAEEACDRLGQAGEAGRRHEHHAERDQGEAERGRVLRDVEEGIEGAGEVFTGAPRAGVSVEIGQAQGEEEREHGEAERDEVSVAVFGAEERGDAIADRHQAEPREDRIDDEDLRVRRSGQEGRDAMQDLPERSEGAEGIWRDGGEGAAGGDDGGADDERDDGRGEDEAGHQDHRPAYGPDDLPELQEGDREGPDEADEREFEEDEPEASLEDA